MTTTLILCGGRGTRAFPHTIQLPKPLLEVAGRPILEHVMRIYAAQGHTRFVLAAGFRADLVRSFAESVPDDWDVDVVDTGEDTNKAARILACRDRLGSRFFVTYGDGVGNVDLARLLDFHDAHEGDATVTVVPLPSQFGTIRFAGDGRVDTFLEKPRIEGYWINAGFFVMDETVFDAWSGDDLEREICPGLAKDGRLFAYEHGGFWRWMDTYKEALELSDIAAAARSRGEEPPWAP